MIIIKNDIDISKIKKSGEIVALVNKKIKENINPGISLLKLNEIAEQEILKLGAIPSFKNYQGFPFSICTSLNNIIIHGMPSKIKLKKGDIISIDIGAFYNGFHADSAFTSGVGKISLEKKYLIEVTENSFYEGLKNAKPGKRIGDISNAIQKTIENAGFSVVREFTGHGIGENLHEEPSIPNYGIANKGLRLEEGMVLAIEPMANMGNSDIEILNDGWSVSTKDKKPSAHYEHTIAITSKGESIILTSLE